MSEVVVFSQGWVEEVVCKVLGKKKGEICQTDIEKIQYLRIGESFDNDFFVEMSVEEPPMPFVDTDGGDEWGCTCLRNDDLSRFVDEQDNAPQLYTFGFDFEDEELQEYAWSESATQKWDAYKQSICQSDYYEEIEDYNEWEKWYFQTKAILAQELKIFTGVKVLRIKGLEFEDYSFLTEFGQLEVLEVVETRFNSSAQIEELKRLKQLCCWLD